MDINQLYNDIKLLIGDDDNFKYVVILDYVIDENPVNEIRIKKYMNKKYKTYIIIKDPFSMLFENYEKCHNVDLYKRKLGKQYVCKNVLCEDAYEYIYYKLAINQT